MSRRREDWIQTAGVSTDDLLMQMYGERRRRTDRLAQVPEVVVTVDEARSRLWRGITVALALEIAVVMVLAAGAAAWRWL